MEPVEPVLKNIYQSNTYRKDLSWPYLDDKPKVQEKQQVKDQQSYISIFAVCPFYLIIGKVDGYIGSEKNKSKYLVFHSTNEKKEVLKKNTELWNGIKSEIEIINGGKKGEYGKDFMKIKFHTDDNLLLNEPLKLYLLIIIARCIFEEHDKFISNFI